MPSRRRAPPSLIWLTALIGTAVLVAVGSGATLYVETRHAARVQADAMTGGRWRRGKAAITHFQCGACHVIPGITAATGKVGPDLTGIGSRAIIAGDQMNGPATLARFIAHPRQVHPRSAMPDLGVGAFAARDIAAYLYAESS